MPLTYDMTEVTDFEALHEDRFQGIITDVLIWCSMPLQVGVITEDNYRLVHLGIQVLEMGGPLLFAPADDLGKNKPYSITAEDVRRRIGLRTNTGSGSKTQIAKNIRRIVSDRIKEASR
jgi:hypothetical protein